MGEWPEAVSKLFAVAGLFVTNPQGQWHFVHFDVAPRSFTPGNPHSSHLELHESSRWRYRE